MIPTAKELRAEAWNALREGSYWPFVGALLILSLISVGFIFPSALIVGITVSSVGDNLEPVRLYALGMLLATLIAVPLLYFSGLNMFSQSTMSLLVMRRNMKFEQFWSGWGHGWRTVWLMLVQSLYIQLWCLLLIVPGIMKAFSYSMAYFVLADHPDWGANQCLAESQRLMKGSRWRLFCLNFSFIGWYLLLIAAAFLPCGGFAQYFLFPYVYSANAAFYEDLKARSPNLDAMLA